MTKKQKQTQIRNHHILRLRGMWQTAQQLLPNSYKQVQALIDAQLANMGALTTEQHRKTRSFEP